MSSAEKTFAFHIGAHTTGSWLLQRHLTSNAEALRASGVVYLPRATVSSLVARGDKLVRAPEPFTAAVRSALDRPDVHMFLTSHENTLNRPFAEANENVSGCGLYPTVGPTLAALAELSAPYRRAIVLSVRPQDEFLESYYLHTVNAGNADDFASWVGALDLADLSWRPLVDLLVAAFGAESIRILDYGRLEHSRGAYLREFCELIGLEPPGSLDDAVPVDGIGPSDKALRLLLAANPYLSAWDERAELRWFLQRTFSGPDYPQPILLSEHQRSELRDRYASEYDDLVAAPIAGANAHGGRR